METMKFKTNINCSNCVAKVTPFLDKKVGKDSWSVDTESEDKILTVDNNELTAEEIVKTIKCTGFEANPIK